MSQKDMFIVCFVEKSDDRWRFVLWVFGIFIFYRKFSLAIEYAYNFFFGNTSFFIKIKFLFYTAKIFYNLLK